MLCHTCCCYVHDYIFNTITSDYRKRIKDVQIDIDDNAKILKNREETQDAKERERWIRQEKYFEDID